MEPIQIFLLIAGLCVFGGNRVRDKILDRAPLWLDGLISCGAATVFVAGITYGFWKDMCLACPLILLSLFFIILYLAYVVFLPKDAQSNSESIVEEDLPDFPLYFKPHEPY